MQVILYFAEKSRKSPILSMKKLLYFAQKLSISPIFSKIPFSYISDFGRYHPWSTDQIITMDQAWVIFNASVHINRYIFIYSSVKMEFYQINHSSITSRLSTIEVSVEHYLGLNVVEFFCQAKTLRPHLDPWKIIFVWWSFTF